MQSPATDLLPRPVPVKLLHQMPTSAGTRAVIFAMNSHQSNVISQVRGIVQQRLRNQGAGHGFDHVQRVVKSARIIHASVGGDLFVIELAALLHDIGDAKFHDGQERSAEFTIEILQNLEVDAECTAHVAAIVDNVSFRKRDIAEKLTLEGQVVQDADRLDALGAIGIVRTIEYGAAFGQPFHSTDNVEQQTGINHFHEKLFKLRGLMNTSAAYEMATQREGIMRAFLAQYLDECAATDPSVGDSS